MTGEVVASPVVVPKLASEAPVDVKTSRRGVVVVGVGADAATSAWPVAQAIYADEAVRPAIKDAEARVLAGQPPPSDAAASLKELADLRSKLGPNDDAATRALLAEIARRTQARAIAIATLGADSAIEVRIWDAADDRIEATRHRRESTTGWAPLVSTLRARYGALAPTPPTKTPAAPKKEGGSFLTSPWFWGAVGAAALGGVAAWALTRDDPQSAPVRVQWK